jgi:hypothetical protein
MSVIIEMDAENIDQAESIGRVVWERCAPVCQEIEGVKWMLPVGDFKERAAGVLVSNQDSGRDR